MRIDQEEAAEHEGDEAADAEGAEARQEGFGHHQCGAERDQCDPDPVHRQHVQGIEGDQQADRAGDAGYAEARAGELEEQPVDADHHQHDRQLRIGQCAEQAQLPVRLHDQDFGVGGGKGDGLAVHLDLATVELGQKRGQVFGDEIDDAGLQCLGRRQAGGFDHRLLGELEITSAQFGEATQIGSGIVDRLAFHRAAGLRFGGLFLPLLAAGFRGRLRPAVAAWRHADGHRRRRAEIGRRRHRGDVAGIEDVGAGTRRARTLGMDEGGDGYR